MAEPIVWGLLPKAQTNPATVDDDISNAIAAHNTDPNAHTATGQSLDVHRVNAIIDHPAGSIPVDKITNLSSYNRIDFVTLSSWATVGDVELATPSVGIQVAGVVGTISYMTSDSWDQYFGLDFSTNPLFQIALRVEGFVGSRVVFGSGSFNDDGADLTFGFYVNLNVLYGLILVNATYYTVVLPIPDTYVHIWRAYVDPITHDAHFLIDGVEHGVILATTYRADALAYGPTPTFATFYLENASTLNQDIAFGQLITGNVPS